LWKSIEVVQKWRLQLNHLSIFKQLHIIYLVIYIYGPCLFSKFSTHFLLMIY